MDFSSSDLASLVSRSQAGKHEGKHGFIMPVFAISPDFLVQSTPPKPIRLGGEAVREFLPGWRPKCVYTEEAPINLLFLQHDDGAWAVWFLNDDMEHLSSEHSGLAPGASNSLFLTYCRLFDGIWNSLVISPNPPQQTDPERLLFQLPVGMRRQMLDFYLSKFDFATEHASIPMPPNLPTCGKVVDLGVRRVLLETAHLQQIFDPSGLQAAYVRLLRTGALTWPSPVDGRELQATHAYVLGGNRFAYRLIDERHQLTFYLVADEIHFRVVCVYLAQARLALGPEALHSQAASADLSRAMFHHVLEHGEELGHYLQLPAQQVANAWRGVSAMHLGHVLWNDISGIGNLVASVPARQLPRFLVFDAGSEPEMYGPLDEMFPEIRGKVTRDAGSFDAAVPTFYRSRTLLIKATGLRVSRSTRERITDLMLRSPANAECAAACRTIAERGGPIIILGLRTENRTLTDLPGFCESLVGFLAQEIGRATLVIDGHNSRMDASNRLIRSHGETDATRSPAEVEAEIALALQRRAAGTGIRIVSTIGLSLQTSLIWGHHSVFFVTLWGAGLAKYRWVCNKPGLVITSRWNLLNRADLAIYSDPLYQEDPAPMEFIDAAAVRDRPEAPLLVPLGTENNPSIMNFDLDEHAAFCVVRRLLDRHAGRLGRTGRHAEQLTGPAVAL